MLVTSKWIKNHQSAVNNGRSDAVIMDLPPEKGGDDYAATALEYAVMALAGCITTIFSVVAKNSHVEIADLEAIVDAKKPDGASTITEAKITINVNANAPEEKLKRILRITLKQCPVETLYRQANIKMDIQLNGKE
jgi:uncharacterized OsmC-like protein